MAYQSATYPVSSGIYYGLLLPVLPEYHIALLDEHFILPDLADCSLIQLDDKQIADSDVFSELEHNDCVFYIADRQPSAYRAVYTDRRKLYAECSERLHALGNKKKDIKKTISYACSGYISVIGNQPYEKQAQKHEQYASLADETI